MVSMLQKETLGSECCKETVGSVCCTGGDGGVSML